MADKPDTSPPRDGFAFVMFALMLAWAPLPFASNTVMFSNVLVVLVGLAALAWALCAFRDARVNMVPFRRYRWFVWLTLALTVWVIVQNANWTPSDWHHPFWRSAGAVLGMPEIGSIGLTPNAGYQTLLRILAYILTFLLAMQLGRSGEGAARVTWLVILIAIAYALYGLIIKVGDLEMVAWEEKIFYQDSLTSTFINRNSYGTFAALGLLVICGMLSRRMRATGALGSLRGGALAAFIDRLTARDFVLFAGFIMVGSALLLTNSRGASLSFLVAVIVLFLLIAAGRRSWRASTLIAGAIILAGGYLVFSASSAGLISRLLEFDRDIVARQEVAAITIRAIGDHPWVGTGFGSFQGLFAAYRDASIDPAVAIYDKAHNTYLEWALEAGLPATVLMVGTIGFIAIMCARGAVVRRRNTIYPAVGAAATTLVAVHALVDFSLQIPAVTVYYAAILGVGYAQSWSTAGDEPVSRRPVGGLEDWRAPERA